MDWSILFFPPEKDHTLYSLSLTAMGQGTFVFPSVNSTPPDNYEEIYFLKNYNVFFSLVPPSPPFFPSFFRYSSPLISIFTPPCTPAPLRFDLRFSQCRRGPRAQKEIVKTKQPFPESMGPTTKAFLLKIQNSEVN